MHEDRDATTRGLGYQARGSVAVIALPSRADSACVLALRSRSERALVTGSRAIAVDLSATEHIDTRTLSELSIVLRRISRHRAKVAVVGADARIRWVLELCGIDELEFHPTIRRALGGIGSRVPLPPGSRCL